jgi:phage terminase large subunit
MHLSINQTRAFDLLEDRQTTELLYGGGAGGGKSMLGCLWLITVCSSYPGTRWLMGRSELKNLKQTTLKSFFEVTSKLNLKTGVDFSYNQGSSSIFFSNGSEILLKDLYAYPSDPEFDGLGSLEITGAFVDECNQITEKAKAIVKSRIRYKLDEHGIVPKMLMTCNPAKNWVYQQFYKPFKSNTLSREKAFIQSLVTDNPFISKHYIEN